MPKVGDRGTKRLREKYQDSRVEDGVFGAGISHRMSLPYRSNSHARSFARRLELNPVTYRTLLVSRVEEGFDDGGLTSYSEQSQRLNYCALLRLTMMMIYVSRRYATV